LFPGVIKYILRTHILLNELGRMLKSTVVPIKVLRKTKNIVGMTDLGAENRTLNLQKKL